MTATPGRAESKLLIMAVTDLILEGADQIEHTIETEKGWKFTVTVKVERRGVE